MSDKTYNGWTNYETWNVALWIDNDQGSQEYWIERATELVKENGKEDSVSDLADEIQGQHEDNCPEVMGCYADLLNAALAAVDWRELAEHYMDEAAMS